MDNCSTSRITGCDFTLFPMSAGFVDIILSALNDTDTSKVWKKTDNVSTCVRGKLIHVFDVTKAILLHATKTGEHVAMTGTFSIGCPGDSTGNVYMDETDEPVNEKQSGTIFQKAGCKFALYPLGNESYLDNINEEIDLLKDGTVEVSSTHYATRLDGDVHDIFKTMQDIFDRIQQKVSHVTLVFTISANSPSTKKSRSN